METLNILTKADIPDVLTENDTLLLIQDALYLLLDKSFLAKFANVYALEVDIKARLAANNLDLSKITVLNYEKFVELCCKFKNNVTW